jgi:hypothetical protein
VGYPTKIMTCCYCGTRAALVLKEQGRHELACGSCGAPLHDLKMLPKARVQDHETVRSNAIRKPSIQSERYEKRRKPRKGKRRKGLVRWMLEEAWDTIEDAVEDIFD